MKSEFDPTVDLIKQINDLIDRPDRSIALLLNRAARLANVVDDKDMLSLFELHLEGIDEFTKEGLNKNVLRVTGKGRPSEEVVEMFIFDRGIQEDELSAHSAQELETMLAETIVDLEEHYDPRLDTVKRSIEATIGKIRNRIAVFVRKVERFVYEKGTEKRVEDKSTDITPRIFLGHGRSQVWRDLKDFVQDRLGLPWDEFNRESPAGLATKERLMEMLDGAAFAFLVMTAEDEHTDQTLHARENVIHEIGLFQGRLGFRKAIILLEDGCKEFSNVIGLTQIRFPKGNIKAEFEEIRRVLEREGLLENSVASP